MANLYAVDDRAPSAQLLKDFLGVRGHAVLPVNRTQGMWRVATDIVALARRHPTLNARVTRLYLMGHGDAGQLIFGTGLNRESAIDFAPLRQVLGGGALGGIMIYGCAVASAVPATAAGSGTTDSGWQTERSRASVTGGRGYQMLHALARAAAVSVSAAVIRQELGPSGYERLLRGHGYQGEVMTVAPTGTFTISRMRADGTVSELRNSETDYV